MDFIGWFRWKFINFYNFFSKFSFKFFFFLRKFIPKLKLFPRYLQLWTFFTVGIFWLLIIKCGWNETAIVDDFWTPNITHLLVFPIKFDQLHDFVNKFKRYLLIVRFKGSDDCCVVCELWSMFYKVKSIWCVYPRLLSLSVFIVSINVLKCKLNNNNNNNKIIIIIIIINTSSHPVTFSFCKWY